MRLWNFLEILQRGWLRFANWIGRGAMTLFYFTLFAPFALLVRLFVDPLESSRAEKSSYFEDARQGDRTIEQARRQT